jgi:hypothetical protein
MSITTGILVASSALTIIVAIAAIVFGVRAYLRRNTPRA